MVFEPGLCTPFKAIPHPHKRHGIQSTPYNLSTPEVSLALEHNILIDSKDLRMILHSSPLDPLICEMPGCRPSRDIPTGQDLAGKDWSMGVNSCLNYYHEP